MSILRKDWVERQIEAVARALARLLQLERERRYAEAAPVVAEAVASLTGMSLESVLSLGPVLTAEALGETARIRALALLLDRDAALRRKARLEGVEARELCALGLYRAAQAKGDGSLETEEAATRLLERMDLAKAPQSE